MYSFTIAIAKKLLESGRSEDVSGMIDPLIGAWKSAGEPDSQCTPEFLQMHCLRARIMLINDSQPDESAPLLRRFAIAPTAKIENAAQAEVLLWLGWSLALSTASVSHPARTAYILKKAATYFAATNRIKESCYAYIALASLFDRQKRPSLCEEVLSHAHRMHAFVRDPVILDIYQSLQLRYTAGDGATATAFSNELSSASARVHAIHERALRSATTKENILIIGERGTGKSQLARYIHTSSDADPATFRHIDCQETDAASPFGISQHEFDALAEIRGTLFLQYVEALPSDHQYELVRYIEASKSNCPRIIASTSADLEKQVQLGLFHEVLFYTLHSSTIQQPALRERPEDIRLLTDRFLTEFTPQGAPLVAITDKALEALSLYHWPGNIRQLRNEIERILVHIGLEPVPIVHLQSLSSNVQAALRKSRATTLPDAECEGPLEEILADTERRVIESALSAHDGQVTASANFLGLTRQGLYKKIKRLGIIVSRSHHTGVDKKANKDANALY